MAAYKHVTTASDILKAAKRGQVADGPSTQKRNRADYRQEKELEELRKTGDAPAVSDVETGRDINPHIPQFITQAPWYAGATGATLKHQRPHPERERLGTQLEDWYKRGTTNKVATKYRKGACENCGAMTHKRRDCFERPRKIGARFTGEDFAPDDHQQPELHLDFDAKRDRWAGYDATEHKEIIDEYRRLDDARKLIRAEEEAKRRLSGEGEGGEEEKVDEDLYAERMEMPGVKTDMDSATRITVRNLRIREDTANYLFNLDPNSAHYDPKSRSMRENPFEGTNKEMEAVKFMGQNFLKHTGEVGAVAKAELFAWDAKRRGVDAHTLAEPTKLEKIIREYETAKTSFKKTLKSDVLDKYGGEEHLMDAEARALVAGAQSEAYREYNRRGEVVAGEERVAVRSRYDEDHLQNNHTAVWGSHYADGRWGYKCCLQTILNSYCTRKPGDSAPVVQESPMPTPATDDGDAPNTGSAASTGSEPKKRARAQSSSSSSSSSGDSDSSSSSDSDDDAKVDKPVKQRAPVTDDEKLAAALKKARQQQEEAEAQLAMGERKRGYNKKYEFSTPTEHDMEAYRLTQVHAADPMAAFMHKKPRRE